MRKPSFVGLFQRHVEVGEWVSCRELAARANPTVGGNALTDTAKDYSRRLSNLERYGHVQRRPSGGVFVYARRETVADPGSVKVIKSFWFPT